MAAVPSAGFETATCPLVLVLKATDERRQVTSARLIHFFMTGSSTTLVWLYVPMNGDDFDRVPPKMNVVCLRIPKTACQYQMQRIG